MHHKIPAYVEHFLGLSEAQGRNAYLAMIAHVKGDEKSHQYENYPIVTEFFSDYEASELICSFREHVGYCELFTSENDFFDFIGCKKHVDLSHGMLLAYSTVSPIRARAASALVPLFCAANGVATCTIDPYGLALTENKFHTCMLLRQFGLPIPDTWLFIPELGWWRDLAPPIGHKVIAKPVYESASIGIDNNSVFYWDKSNEDFLNQRSLEVAQPLMVQTFISGREVEVPVIGSEYAEAIPPCAVMLDGSVDLGNSFMTYDLIYNDAYSYEDFSIFDSELAIKISALAQSSHRALSLDGISRVDFRVSEENVPYITDLNAIPHLTRHGAVASSFNYLGLPYEAMAACLIGIGVDRAMENNTLQK